MRHHLHDGKACAHRAFRCILMRSWPSEVGENAVTHELGDMAFEPADFASNRILVAADDITHVFRVKLRRERR